MAGFRGRRRDSVERTGPSCHDRRSDKQGDTGYDRGGVGIGVSEGYSIPS